MCKRVLWLTSGSDTLPSVRFRVLPIAREMQTHGVSVTVVRYPKSIVQKLKFFATHFLRYDVCVIQKRLVRPVEVNLLRRLAQKIVYDFDDAVWTDGNESAPIGGGRLWDRFCQTVSSVDMVIAGNQYLASASSRSAKVVVIPTPIDTKYYIPLCDEKLVQKKFTIGWMGTSSYLPEVERISTVIHDATRHKVQIISNEVGRNSSCVYNLWKAEDELSMLQDFSIGLMPLENNNYNFGKCGFKLLQYMSCGIPCVASSVGYNSEIINGNNGLLVDNEKDWIEHVRLLEGDSNKSIYMRKYARDFVVKNFDLSIVANKFLEILLA